ncbi:trypsin-like serine protease [Microbacterium sp.]|uniref:trypsin-like serine protease n=1 Tax=Microbacterium sp. TaxID=51671 RepID=UPI003A84AC0E
MSPRTSRITAVAVLAALGCLHALHAPSAEATAVAAPVSASEAFDLDELVAALDADVSGASEVSARAAETGEGSGYGSLVTQPGSSVADLYWKGRIPPRVAAVLAANPGIRVRLHEARWSLDELVAARDAAFDLMQVGRFARLDRVAIGPLPDSSGITVLLGAVSAGEARSVDAMLTARTGVRVVVEVDVPEIVPAVARQSDESPYSGGAGIRLYGGDSSAYCSSGVAVVGKSSGRDYLTTAAHCNRAVVLNTGHESGVVKTFGALETVGAWTTSASWVELDRDAAILPIRSGATGSGKVYWGSPSSSQTREVDAASTSPIGATVCPSGANSGTHCDFTVKAKNFVYELSGQVVQNVVWATSSGGAVAQGDSGGPVIRETSSGRYLLGFISGLSGDSGDCNGQTLAYRDASVVCGHDVFYIGNVASVLDELNVRLK